MDDSEYYSIMRRQYSHPISVKKKKIPEPKARDQQKLGNTPGSFSEWTRKYGHEDAEMFSERNDME
ncbi:MAG: hypothetical protein SOZ72_07525 [Treponema sp.]|nr:hypothetical protein [Spirochaetia bacterium]MDD7581075.1 hypothetical protein [Treponema sp.]MDY3759209.1 hypothetical protein [Treponema sp.]MDY5837880.1 hypothetical protein [Treponema sp.]